MIANFCLAKLRKICNTSLSQRDKESYRKLGPLTEHLAKDSPRTRYQERYSVKTLGNKTFLAILPLMAVYLDRGRESRSGLLRFQVQKLSPQRLPWNIQLFSTGSLHVPGWSGACSPVSASLCLATSILLMEQYLVWLR